ncbi:hypothetical protein H0H93_008927 [Arthromyces matolae]|nr:hypothetical protein H0H93_008927 [Arthromyces matolae]
MEAEEGPNFRAYSTPLSHLAYTDEYFNTKTIFEAVGLLDAYPIILPVGSVTSVEFTPDLSLSASATVIMPREVLPHIQDLQPVTRFAEEQYTRNGMRSIKVHFVDGGCTYERVYHMAKLNLIRNICNNGRALHGFSSLLEHLQTIQSPLQQSFGNMLFTSRIQGFFVTTFPLYQLDCLLNENWLQEDVFNALVEMAYFRRAYRYQSSLNVPPNTLLLPTSFLNDVLHIFNSENRTYTPEMLDLRLWEYRAAIISRWYQDKKLELRNIPAVPAREAQAIRTDIHLSASRETPLIEANPLQVSVHRAATVPPNPTQTIPARTVFHEANAALRPLTNGIQTQEQLNDLLQDLEDLRSLLVMQLHMKGIYRSPPSQTPKDVHENND